MLKTIGFDADDTLWHHERFYRFTEERFTALLDDHGDRDVISARLLEVEKRNLARYGFGIKGFTLSMIETAVEVTDGQVPGTVIGEILAYGRDLLRHPVEPLPHVRDVLQRLAPDYELVLITKGDLFDQERKLAQSGLGDFFDAIEVVSDKSIVTYQTVFQRHGGSPEHAMMVGNSVKSDIIPALRAGSWAVHVPCEVTWAIELEDLPLDATRLRQIKTLGELPAIIDAIV